MPLASPDDTARAGERGQHVGARPGARAAAAHLCRKVGWRDIARVTAVDLAVLFGAAVEGEVVADDTSDARLRACLPVSFVRDELEVRLLVGAAPSALANLGVLLLGAAPSRDEMCDLLREIANTAAGAFKRAVERDGAEATLGLAADAACDHPDPSRIAAQCWDVEVPVTQARLTFRAELIARPTRRVAARRLREGMVLAGCLRDRNGATLVAAGTRLTVSHVMRIAEHVAPCRRLRVSLVG